MYPSLFCVFSLFHHFFCLWTVVLGFRHQLGCKLFSKAASRSARAFNSAGRTHEAACCQPGHHCDSSEPWLPVRSAHCKTKSMSQHWFCLIVKERFCRLSLLEGSKMAFVLLLEPMVPSKQKKMQIRNKLLFTHWLRLKTTPQWR